MQPEPDFFCKNPLMQSIDTENENLYTNNSQKLVINIFSR